MLRVHPSSLDQQWSIEQRFWGATSTCRDAWLPCSPGECIVVNFGASPFAFKLDAMLEEEREQQEAAVQRCALLSVCLSWHLQASWDRGLWGQTPSAQIDFCQDGHGISRIVKNSSLSIRQSCQRAKSVICYDVWDTDHRALDTLVQHTDTCRGDPSAGARIPAALWLRWHAARLWLCSGYHRRCTAAGLIQVGTVLGPCSCAWCKQADACLLCCKIKCRMGRWAEALMYQCPSTGWQIW